MKKLIKNYIALASAFLFLLSALNAKAALSQREILTSGECGNGASYTLYADGEMVISGEGAVTKRFDAKLLGEENLLKLKSLKIEEGIEAIGGLGLNQDMNFDSCPSLESVVIADSVKSFKGIRNFAECPKLVSVDLGNGLKELGGASFRDCAALKSISFPGSMMEIPISTVDGCANLETVKVSIGTSVIGTGAFKNCPKLTSVSLPESVTQIEPEAFEGDVCLENIVLPPSITEISDFLFKGCKSLNNLVIPEGVTSIGEQAFYGCLSLSDITIPDTVAAVEALAFYNTAYITCAQSNIVIGDSFIKYNEGAQSYAMPDTVKRIEMDAFKDCVSLKSVTLSKNLEEIHNSAFEGCTSLESIAIPDKVSVINGRAFYNCLSLASVSFNEGLSQIHSYAFYNCDALTDISFPSALWLIRNNAFDDCGKLKSVRLPEGLTQLGANAFANCKSLENINIPTSLASIGDTAFAACTALSELTVPPSVKSVGSSAFLMCSNLERLCVSGNTVFSSDAFELCDNISFIYYENTLPEVLDKLNCGKLKWSFEPEGGTLSLEGETDAVNMSAAPWKECENAVQRLDLSKALKVEELYGFIDNCPNLKSVKLYSANPLAGKLKERGISLETENPKRIALTWDGSDKIGMADALALFRYAVGIIDYGINLFAADYNNDGDINLVDVLAVLLELKKGVS